MTIHVTPRKLHWNYFLALERDLEAVSRYIEFCEPNFDTFSIELAHLLFAAASEVDVVAKLLCEKINPALPRGTINEYKAVLLPAIPDIPDTDVFVSRYGLSFKPWLSWAETTNPTWWRSYNNVKHERDAHFNEATQERAECIGCAIDSYLSLLRSDSCRTAKHDPSPERHDAGARTRINSRPA